MSHHDDAAHGDKSTILTRTIGEVTGWLGSFPAIMFAAILITTWVVGGAFVPQHFSNDIYQLLINTVTTIITFLMVFVIQNTQNRDGRAVQSKLDAQNEVLAQIARHLHIDASALDEIVGLEDAPERVIKDEQESIRSHAHRG